MQITLENIKAEQTKLAQMIANFQKQPVFPITMQYPELKEGEKFIGAIISADGSKRECLILLPGESPAGDWKSQMAWAASIGGELPDRVESALAFAVMKDEFKEEAYWTREKHASGSGCAWCQGFGNGDQHYGDVLTKLRARAFRRLVIL